MNAPKSTIVRERMLWMAVVAVLSTALAWLASVSLFLLATSRSELPSKALVVVNVLIEAAGTILRSVSWASPIAFAVLLTSAVAIAAAVIGQRGPSGGGAHHA